MHSGFLEMLICFGLPGLILLLLFTALILKRCFGLFTAAGEKSDVRLLTLIPFAITLMNVFDCLFPLEGRLPLLIPLLHALISGYIVEIGCQFSLRTGSGSAKEPPLPG
jgi:O-antigen ligase